MISRSLRKRRITRSNIPQTVTAESGCGGVRSFAAPRPARRWPWLAALLLTCLAGECVHAEDEFRWTATSDGLLPAVSSGRADLPRPESGGAKATTLPASLRRSRQLLNQIRNGYVRQDSTISAPTQAAPRSRRTIPASLQPVSPDAVPAVPTAAALSAARPASVNGAADRPQEAGVVVIPSVLPPESLSDADATDIQLAGRRRNSGSHPQKKKQKVHTADGHAIVRNLRRGTTKIREAGCWLIEYCDPEVFDEDEYHMPILLVGASEEDSTEQPPGSGLLARSLTDIQPTLNYAWGDWEQDELPEDFHERMDNGTYVKRYCPQTVLQWAPTNLWYHPLYFQDVGLERYGHTHKPWVQPFVSSGKFFGQFVGLPYQMVLHPPKSREFALGYYQPGEWAPKKKLAIPFNEEAAATEFLWVTGIILLIP